MAESKRSIPHFFVSIDIVIDPLLDALSRLAQGPPGGPRVSATAGMIRAVAGTLREPPHFLISDQPADRWRRASRRYSAPKLCPMTSTGGVYPSGDGLAVEPRIIIS